MISWKQSYDSENETLILETKLQIRVIIRSFPTQKKTLIWEMKFWSWKQNFKFELLLQVANKASNLNCNSRMETKLWYEKETWILETKLRSSKLNFEFVFQKKNIGNKISSESFNGRLETKLWLCKRSFDWRNETKMLDKKLSIWFIIAGWKQSFESVLL